jgi:hypothetical protein
MCIAGHLVGAETIPKVGFGPGKNNARTTDEFVRFTDVALPGLGYAQLAIDLL